MKTLDAVHAFLYNRRTLNRSSQTISWYESNLNRFAAFSEELPIEPEAIEKFLVEVAPDGKDESRHAYYRTLKAFYHFVHKRFRLHNPVDIIDPPTRHKKVRPTLTASQLNQLCSQRRSLRDTALISLIVDCGVRAGEVVSLKKQNIFDDYILVDGKTGQREVPISEETRRLLVVLSKSNGPKSQVVFQGRQGPLTRYGIYKIIQKCMREAGIAGPKLGPHRIRHAFGKHYIKNGGDTRSLQKIMGHANITTTEIYVELSSDDIIAKHHQFSPLRSAHAGAQGSLFENDGKALREAEAILQRGGEHKQSQ